MLKHFIFLIIFLSLSFASDLTKVSLQLQWKHQFEFAGFYAAKEKGFYKDAGLNVQIKEFSNNLDIINDVVEGNTTFATKNASIINDAIDRRDISILSNYFKRSPLVIVSRPDIYYVKELKNKKIMGVEDQIKSANLKKLFEYSNLDYNDINIIPHTFSLEPFLKQEVDATTIFTTNELYYLQKNKVRFNIIDPNNYGVPLMDVNLFSSKEFVKNNPYLTQKFIEASNKGWEYAFNHQEEIIDLILEKYNTQNKTKEHLKFEAEKTKILFEADISKIGSINKNQILKIANLYDKTIDDELYNEIVFKTNYSSSLNLTKEEIKWLENHPIITAHNEKNWAPINFNKNGVASGFSIDFMNLLAKKIGIKIKYITGEWKDLYDQAIDGKIDILLNIAITPQREKDFIFSESYQNNKMGIFALKENNRFNTLKSLNYKKVAIVDGFLQEYFLKTKYPNIEIIKVRNTIEALKAVNEKKVIATIGSSLILNNLINESNFFNIEHKSDIKTKKDTSLRIAVKKDKQILLSIIQKAMANTGSNEINNLRKKWLQIKNQEKTIFYTKKELLWKKQTNKLKYAVDPNWLPLEHINPQTGEYEGVISDYLNKISKLTNLEFELVKTTNWNETLELIKNKKIDFIPAISKTDKREEYLNFTNKTIELTDALIMNNSTKFISSLNDLKGKKVGVSQGTSIHNLLQNKYPEIIIIPINGTKKGIEELKQGKIDAYAGNLEVISYIILKDNILNLKVALKFDDKRSLHMALKKDFPKEAISVINKAINLISKNEIDTIKQKWIQFKIEDNFDYDLLWKISIGIFGVILFFIVNNRLLQKKVKEKTSTLNTQKIELENLSKNLEKLVDERTKQLNDERDYIEEIHKKTKDSIKYAALIQNSIIASHENFKKHFKDSFVIWEPKDIVGGDIYLLDELNKNEQILMVIDCTGHGVPGAFVTMLIKAIERQIIAQINQNKDQEINPADILKTFNISIKNLLKQYDKDSLSNAGFDGQIIYFNNKNKIVKIASAKNDIFYIQDNTLYTIKSDRHSVGYNDSNPDFEFTNHTIDISAEHTSFYFTSDGYIDQLGGQKERSFGKKRLKALIEDIKDKPMLEQKDILEKTLKKYQGKMPRQDDITFIGINI